MSSAVAAVEIRPGDDVTAWLGAGREPVLVAELDGRVVGWARVIVERPLGEAALREV